jgi:hypothetical protein
MGTGPIDVIARDDITAVARVVSELEDAGAVSAIHGTSAVGVRSSVRLERVLAGYAYGAVVTTDCKR